MGFYFFSTKKSDKNMSSTTTTNPSNPNDPKGTATIAPSDSPKKNSGGLTNPTDIRVLELLSKEGPLIRNQIVEMTDIARSTLYDSLLRLILKGYVTKFSEQPKGPGRPKVFFQTIQTK